MQTDSSNYTVGDFATVTVEAEGDATGAWIRTETGEHFTQTSSYSAHDDRRVFTLRWELGKAGERTVYACVDNATGASAEKSFRISIAERAVETQIYKVTVANPSVQLNDWAYMTITTSQDIGELWITNEGQEKGSTVFEIINIYDVNGEKCWDVRWQLGKAGDRTGYVFVAGSDKTVSKSFEVECYE